MSKPNKVNKTNYVQRGRLTPDDMARERMRQSEISGRARQQENVIGRMERKPAERGSTRPRTSREE